MEVSYISFPEFPLTLHVGAFVARRVNRDSDAEMSAMSDFEELNQENYVERCCRKSHKKMIDDTCCARQRGLNASGSVAERSVRLSQNKKVDIAVIRWLAGKKAKAPFNVCAFGKRPDYERAYIINVQDNM